MGAAVKTFLQKQAPRADALPWLARRPQNDAAPAWMTALRETAAESFAETGLPTPAWEGWQYTNLRALDPTKVAYNTSRIDADLPAPLLKDAYRLVLINGFLYRNLSSLPASVEVLDLAADPRGAEFLATPGDFAEQPLKALNAAHMKDGFILRLAKGQNVDKPIEVLFFTTDSHAAYPRVLYHLGENSEASILEHHTGNGQYFANSQADIWQERDSRLFLHRFVEEMPEAVHISQISLTLLKNAEFHGFSGAFTGLLTRQEIRMRLLEPQVSASIGGIYLMKNRQCHDFTVLADHFEQSGTSAQHFKGVINDQARAVFQGKIHVRRSAQKTDGYQSHHALLLSQDAEASAKPELEIYADDVKCSHGATSGRLDENALFYLRSRGIPESEARALLIRSFLSDKIENIKNENIRDLYLARVDTWLTGEDQT